MRLDPYDIEPPPPRAVQQPERLSPFVNPTKYDRTNGVTIVMDKPVDMYINGVRWLLDSGFFVRRDLIGGVSVRGGFQNETTNDATDRLMMFRYLSSEKDIVAIAEVVRLDQYRRWAIAEDGERFPSDASLEALLRLVGDGAVAYAIRRYDGNIAYKVMDAWGVLAAISPWSQRWQDWLEQQS